MKKSNTFAAFTLAAALFALPAAAIAAEGDSMMMMAPKDAIMAPKDAMMAKDSMPKDTMMMKNQQTFSDTAFKAASASGKPFVVAFHKNGCPLCISQQKALDALYTDPAFSDLQVLVVTYPTDSANIEKFKAEMQGTLIVFEGEQEINRSQKLTTADEIAKQIQG